MELEWETVGSRSRIFYKSYKSCLKRVYRRIVYTISFIFIIVNFFFRLKKNKDITVVHLNPSMIIVPLIRDGVLLLLSKCLKRKVLVCFHGWNVQFAEKLSRKGFAGKLFVKVFGRADFIFVLAEQFQNTWPLYFKSQLITSL